MVTVIEFTYNHLDTTLAPEIGTTGLQCDKKYILIFIDLDAILPGTKVQSIILHWYQSHLLVDCTNPHHPSLIVPGKSHEDRGPLAASYIAPRAPPHTRHRYVFLLFAQPSEYLFPDCFSHVFPETPSARSGFDIRRFAQAAGLDLPLAMNFFIGRHEPTDGGPTSVFRATKTSFRSVNCPTSATRSLYEANHTWRWE
ncbi:unnamed protein product [Penicillium olsonii]|nr:unnamed protein product [Penicillium olsonii]